MSKKTLGIVLIVGGIVVVVVSLGADVVGMSTSAGIGF